MPSQGKDGKKLELAQVIAPYEATSKEQLSLVQVNKKNPMQDEVHICAWCQLNAVEVLYLI